MAQKKVSKKSLVISIGSTIIVLIVAFIAISVVVSSHRSDVVDSKCELGYRGTGIQSSSSADVLVENAYADYFRISNCSSMAGGKAQFMKYLTDEYAKSFDPASDQFTKKIFCTDLHVGNSNVRIDQNDDDRNVALVAQNLKNGKKGPTIRVITKAEKLGGNRKISAIECQTASN